MMYLSIPHPHLSDALERAYSNFAFDAPQPLCLKSGLKKLGASLWHAGKAAGRFLGEAINAQAEARARDMRYSRTPW
ncbi:hypothetical protein [Castellaniella sp.]|uniref:hypothetical protein n=1 Tax=Castellaniella sp. TaxID=1955812 RepID=UPI0035642770